MSELKLEFWRDITPNELLEINNTLKESGQDLEKRLYYLISNQILCVKNSIYFRIQGVSSVDFTERNVRRYKIVINTIEEYSNEELNKIRELPMQELLPIKPSRKVRADKECTL